MNGAVKQHPLTLVVRDSNKMLLDNLKVLSAALEDLPWNPADSENLEIDEAADSAD